MNQGRGLCVAFCWILLWMMACAWSFGAPLPPEPAICGSWVCEPVDGLDERVNRDSVWISLLRDGTGSLSHTQGGCAGYWQIRWHRDGGRLVVQPMPRWYSEVDLPELWLDLKNMRGQWTCREGGWPCVARRG